MTSVSNPDNSGAGERAGRPLWYFVAAGAVAGGAVITSSLLPQEVFGLAWVAAAIVFSQIDRVVARSSPVSTRLRRGAVAYVVVIGILLVGALVAVVIAVRDSELWVAWSMAGLAFAVFAGGSWIVDRRLSEATPPDPAS